MGLGLTPTSMIQERPVGSGRRTAGHASIENVIWREDYILLYAKTGSPGTEANTEVPLLGAGKCLVMSLRFVS